MINKKLSVLLFSSLTVLVFWGCQSMDEAMISPTEVYKYGTKEFNQQNQAAFYDYGARYYEPALGRFAAIEPQAETHYSISPYTYVLDKPVRIDLPTDSLAKVLLVPADSLFRKKVLLSKINRPLVGEDKEDDKNKPEQ